MKNHEDLMEAYFQGTLSDEENVLCEQLLRDDIAFKKAFEFHSDLKKAINVHDSEEFGQFIGDIERNERTSGKTKNYTKWLAAASIALLLGLIYFVNTNTSNTSEQLFTVYFEPYRNVIYPLERTSQLQNEKALAFEAYENGDYENAALLFSEMYTKTNESYNLFYEANALLKLGKVKEALPLLLQHKKTKDPLTEKTPWYLALTYLKLEDTENTKRTLQEIIEQNGYKAREAKELLIKFD